MASNQLSPGVVVLERDLTTVANQVTDNVGVIAGAFEKGPVEEVTDVVSEKDLLARFGKPNDQNFEFWFSAAQFLQYGGTLKVIRAVNSGLRNAIDKATVIATVLTANDTVVSVADATDFDVTDYIKIDNEIMEVAAVDGNDVTVIRARLATVATQHNPGAPITLIEKTGDATTINEGSTFSASDTTLTVSDAETLNVSVNEFILIDSEILKVTGVNGNNLTVVRGEYGTAAATHTDSEDVYLLSISVAKTTINEQTLSGVTAPLIKNLDAYVNNFESNSNLWNWAARTPGIYGNSLRIVATDAGADQVLSLNSPATGEAEWQFTVGDAVSFSAANVYGRVYNYSVIINLQNTSVTGTFVPGDAIYLFTTDGGASANVNGTVVAYDNGRRELEVSIDPASTGRIVANYFIENDDRLGTALVETVERKLYVVLNKGSKSFQANQTVGMGITITAVRQEYEDRVYGDGQKWINVAPRPTTSPFISERGGFRDEMHILVFDEDGKLTGTPGSLLEKFLFVSKASNAKGSQGENNYYKDVIKANSAYLYWGAHETDNLFDVDVDAQGDIGSSGLNRSFDIFKNSASINSTLGDAIIGTKNNSTIEYTFQGGVDGYSLTRDAVLSAYDLVADAETTKVDYLIMGPSFGSQADSVAKAQKLIDIANDRKDCLAFISPIRGDVIGQTNNDVVVDKLVDYYTQLSSSSYTVFDSNYKYIYDKYNDTYRYIPCNADVAGLCLQTTLNQEPWFSPAGLNRGQLKNAIKLAYSPLKAQRDKLYANRINPIVSFPGQGIVLFGDKTALGYQSAFDRINVRRLFLTIERTISEAAKSMLFELNDEATRSAFKNIVEPYMRQVQGRRGVLDFLVVCDTSNNPPDAIDRGEFYAEIFVKPTRSINYITLTFTATRTGTSFAEITGQGG